MASENRVMNSLSEKFAQIRESLNDQVWFQELKEKWEAFDPETRLAVKLGSLVLAVLTLLVFLMTFVWGVYKLKSNVKEKSELIQYIQNSYEEFSRLRTLNSELGGGSSAEDSTPWAQHVQGIATQAAIDPTNITLGPEQPGHSTDSVKEATIEASLKKVSIKQVVKFAHQVERSSRPMKLTKINITTHEDASGYLDATLTLQGYTLVAQ